MDDHKKGSLKFKLETIVKKLIKSVENISGQSENSDDILHKLANPINIILTNNQTIEFTEDVESLVRSNTTLGKWIDQDVGILVDELINNYDIKKIIFLIDEFSWLQQQNQQEYIAEKILALSKSNFRNVKFKISIMEGMFLVNPNRIQFNQHGFSTFNFEIGLMDIFSKSKNNDAKLEQFYSHIYTTRLHLGNLDTNLTEYFDQDSFMLLCKYSGFKIRDFINFAKSLARRKVDKTGKISLKDVRYVCGDYFSTIMGQFHGNKFNNEINYLKRVITTLKKSSEKSRYYYTTTEPLDEWVNVLLYYKIISLISTSGRLKQVMEKLTEAFS